jgi:pimeloyl-ACP methyl ester carboxylesterase
MTLERIEIGALALECEIRGTGEPVLLIHGGAFADGFMPLLEQPALRRYRLVRYRREAYGQSGCLRGPTSIAQQAAQALALARQLGIEHAHVVGHSSGGSIALQLGRDGAARVCRAPPFATQLVVARRVACAPRSESPDAPARSARHRRVPGRVLRALTGAVLARAGDREHARKVKKPSGRAPPSSAPLNYRRGAPSEPVGRLLSAVRRIAGDAHPLRCAAAPSHRSLAGSSRAAPCWGPGAR